MAAMWVVVVVEDSHEMNTVSIHPKPLSPCPHLSTILEGAGGTLRIHTHLHRSLVGGGGGGDGGDGDGDGGGGGGGGGGGDGGGGGGGGGGRQS